MFTQLGYKIETFFVEWGKMSILAIKVIVKTCMGRFHPYLVVDHMLHLGVKSFGITAITATFVGMAFTIQVVREFLKFGAGELVGLLLCLAIEDRHDLPPRTQLSHPRGEEAAELAVGGRAQLRPLGARKGDVRDLLSRRERSGRRVLPVQRREAEHKVH